MAEKKTTDMEIKEDTMHTVTNAEKMGQLEEDLPEERLVRRRIGKQVFLVRVHFKEDGAETLQDKICRMLGNEARNSNYT